MTGDAKTAQNTSATVWNAQTTTPAQDALITTIPTVLVNVKYVPTIYLIAIIVSTTTPVLYARLISSQALKELAKIVHFSCLLVFPVQQIIPVTSAMEI
jgi:hypothetical protein